MIHNSVLRVVNQQISELMSSNKKSIARSNQTSSDAHADAQPTSPNSTSSSSPATSKKAANPHSKQKTRNVSQNPTAFPNAAQNGVAMLMGNAIPQNPSPTSESCPIFQNGIGSASSATLAFTTTSNIPETSSTSANINNSSTTQATTTFNENDFVKINTNQIARVTAKNNDSVTVRICQDKSGQIPKETFDVPCAQCSLLMSASKTRDLWQQISHDAKRTKLKKTEKDLLMKSDVWAMTIPQLSEAVKYIFGRSVPRVKLKEIWANIYQNIKHNYPEILF